MRILLDARYLDGTFSGIATYSQHLIQSLSRVDQENEYLVLVRPGFDGFLDVGENFQVLSFAAKPVSLSTIYRLGRMVDSLHVDLMHSFFPIAPLGMRTPLLVTVHDLQPFVDPEFSGRRFPLLQMGYNFFYRNIYPATLRKSKWILTVSHHTRDMVVEHFPNFISKMVVVTSGVNEEIFEPPAVSLDEVRGRHALPQRYVLYYGSTRPNKNLTNMVRGFAQYIQETGDRTLSFVMILKRDRFFRDTARVIRQLGIGDRVLVIDQVPHSDQRAILGGAAAFLFATKYEGFGFPALEAMAARVPVLAGDSGALPETCADAAEFVEPDDIDQIAEGIRRLLGDPVRRSELVEKGEIQVRRFDWKNAAEIVRDVYALLF